MQAGIPGLFWGGGVVSFSIGAPTHASAATVPGPLLARWDSRDSYHCAFFFFTLLGVLTSTSSMGVASDRDGDGTGGLMSSGTLHRDGTRSDQPLF